MQKETTKFFHEHTEKHHEIFMESKLKELKLQKEKNKSRKLIVQLENVKFVQEERFDVLNSISFFTGNKPTRGF